MTKVQIAARKRELRATIAQLDIELQAYEAHRSQKAAAERELSDLRAQTSKAKPCDMPYYEAGRSIGPRNGNW